MIQDNFVKTFDLEKPNFRGRIVKLGSVLNDILQAHNYEEPVSELLGETITTTLLLSSMLKYEGIFSLQAQGSGPIKMLVSDMTSERIIRGCCSYNAEALEKLSQERRQANQKNDEDQPVEIKDYIGEGHIAFTVDQQGGKDRYQGIVEIKGNNLTESVQHYFTQSEQIKSGIKMSVGKIEGKWRAGAIMVQDVPDMDYIKDSMGNTDEDDWRRTMMLLQTCTDEEFLNPALPADDLLFRLFHEEGIKVYDAKDVRKGCRCSEDKVINIIKSMDRENAEGMLEDGKVSFTCEFCSTNYDFDEAAVMRIINAD